MLICTLQIDRSQLGDRKCLSRNDTFERLNGIKQTRKNCEGLALHTAYGNCSVAVYMGYNQRECRVLITIVPVVTIAFQCPVCRRACPRRWWWSGRV